MINLSIGEAAKKLNTTTHTLRYYDNEGLLPIDDVSLVSKIL